MMAFPRLLCLLETLFVLLVLMLSSAHATLVAQWPFDEGSGTTATDSSGNSHTGTLVGSPSWVTGRVGAFALHFNGISQYMDAAATPFTDTAYSWAMWVQGDAAPEPTYCCTKVLMNGITSESWGFSWSRGLQEAYQAAHHRNAAGAYFYAQIVTTLSAGVWYHVAATYDGTNLKVYLNGALEATTAVSAAIAASGTFRVGSPGDPIYSFPGRVDDLQIYNTALTAGEIATIYAGGGGGGPATGLLKCAPAPFAPSGTGWPLRAYPVYIADTSGNIGPSFAGTVTATLATAPGGGTLTGTTVVTATSTTVAGIGLVWAATFSNLILTGQGTYQLSFAASGLTGCTTGAFTVLPSYHLSSASPARGFGLSVPGVLVTDLDGIAIPQSGAIDAGALQYRSNAPASVVPPPLNFRLGP